MSQRWRIWEERRRPLYYSPPHHHMSLALTSAGPVIVSFLDVLLIPLYRLSEPPTASDRTSESVRQLGEEVMAHLR